MPLASYGLLKGKAIEAKREDDQSSPHYQVHILAGTAHNRIAVNAKSQASPSDLLFLVNENFQHPLTTRLPDLAPGFTSMPSTPVGGGMDYIRGNLFNRLDMRPLPSNLPGPDNDLSDRLEYFFNRAIKEQDAAVYAFGQHWGPEPKTRDKIFNFLPGLGIHDIHMNQGNVAPFLGDDGVWQDGGVLLQFPSTQQWVAIFLAFQSQAWHTDDSTGHAITDTPQLDQVIRIVGALINPIGPAPERERVTILNTSPSAIDLKGWQIADKQKNKFALSGKIDAGATLNISLPSSVQLGNNGGIITLLDNKGLKVDGVSYTADQAKKEGWTVVF
ncbi:MAG TPA: DUF2278 family protein [Candidatus Binatia bacterium]|jgi:uncharacterized protein YukJ